MSIWVDDARSVKERPSEKPFQTAFLHFFHRNISNPRTAYLSACHLLFPIDTLCQIGIEMRADVLPPCVCGLGDGEAAFEQVAVFVFGRSVRFGLVLLPKPQLDDGAAQSGIVAEDAEMALVEGLQDGAAECVLEVV